MTLADALSSERAARACQRWRSRTERALLAVRVACPSYLARLEQRRVLAGLLRSLRGYDPAGARVLREEIAKRLDSSHARE